jgi:hypothetical protein
MPSAPKVFITPLVHRDRFFEHENASIAFETADQ